MNAVSGVVRAPIFFTTIQVFSRLLIIWGILPLAETNSLNLVFPFLVFAWSSAEIIRYAFYFVSALKIKVEQLIWLRYSAFIVLYPLGVICECSLIYFSIPKAREIHDMIEYLLLCAMVLYPVGLIILYMHMLSQRRKALCKKKQ